jgi:hypothetical protein
VVVWELAKVAFVNAGDYLQGKKRIKFGGFFKV